MFIIGDPIRPIYKRNYSPPPRPAILKHYEGRIYADYPEFPKATTDQEEKDMTKEDMVSEFSSLRYSELENMTLIDDGEVQYIRNFKGERCNIHCYTKYDYLKDLNFGMASKFLCRCKNECNSERPCEECLRDKMYLPELQKGDILVAQEDHTLFIYYNDNYVLDTSEDTFKTLDDVKNERIICQVRRLQVGSLQLSKDNLKDTEIWSKA